MVANFLPSGGVSSLMSSRLDPAGLVVVVPAFAFAAGVSSPELVKTQKSLVFERRESVKEVSNENPWPSRDWSIVKMKCKESAANVSS